MTYRMVDEGDSAVNSSFERRHSAQIAVTRDSPCFTADITVIYREPVRDL
jgi:hypothetical protein